MMELKACPFCGAKVLGPCRADYYGAFYIIKHEESCFFKTIFGQHETTIRERSGKINVWNTRATDPTEVSKKCTCDMRTSLVGDGCRYCNPQYYIEMLEDQIKEGDPLIEEIAKWLREAAPYLDEKTERMYLKRAAQVENMRCEMCDRYVPGEDDEACTFNQIEYQGPGFGCFFHKPKEVNK